MPLKIKETKPFGNSLTPSKHTEAAYSKPPPPIDKLIIYLIVSLGQVGYLPVPNYSIIIWQIVAMACQIFS